MSDTYSYRHYTPRREALTSLIEDMNPGTMLIANFQSAIRNLNREDLEGEGLAFPNLYCTCPECYGDGMVKNPKWSDDDDNQEPEGLPCDQCRSTGFVHIVDPPPPVALDDDMPF
jgi:hypothetical protein